MNNRLCGKFAELERISIEFRVSASSQSQSERLAAGLRAKASSLITGRAVIKGPGGWGMGDEGVYYTRDTWPLVCVRGHGTVVIARIRVIPAPWTPRSGRFDWSARIYLCGDNGLRDIYRRNYSISWLDMRCAWVIRHVAYILNISASHNGV